MCLGTPALGQTVYQEVEPNDQKSTANGPFVMTAGDSIVGLSTGASLVSPGNNSADYFIVKTAPLPPGIYQHRLVITTSGTVGHTGTLRGLTQTNGIIEPDSDATLQTSGTSTTPPRYVQWYGFGREETVYFRVTGTALTTQPYTATLETVPVSVIDLGTYYNGTITIDRPAGVTTDVDFWVYDENLNAIPGYGNDDPGSLTREYAPGTYYIAYTNFNLANEQPAAFDEGYRNGAVWDFPGAASCSSTTLLPNLGIRLTDAFDQISTPTPKNSAFDVVWLRFTVTDTPPAHGACCLPDGSCIIETAAGCAALDGTYSGDGVACGSVSCRQPGACCLPAYQCSILSSAQCAAAGGTYMGDGTPCGTCPPPPPGVFPEAEPNDSKAFANGPFQMVSGNTIVGFTTGSSPEPGMNSVDYFIVKTAPAPLGIYRHRLIVTTDGADGHTLTIRGLSQSGGVIDYFSDTTIQTSSSGTTPARFVQWYGFGREEEVYVRIAGTTSTTSAYTITLETVPVSAGNLGTYHAGDITITRAPNVFTDTDFWVYDSNFNPIPDYGNDEPNSLTRHYAPGTYYLALSNFNFANDQPAPFDEEFLNGSVLEFPNAAVNSSVALLPNLAMRVTDVFDSVIVPTPKTGPFEVIWLQFTVGTEPPITGACCLPDGTCVQTTPIGCLGLEGTYSGDGVDCGAANCPAGACCFDNGTCVITGPAGCATLGGVYAGNGVECGAANCPQSGGCCFAGFDCEILTEAACIAAGGTYSGDGTTCAPCSQAPAGSVAVLVADIDRYIEDVVEKLTVTNRFPYVGTVDVMTRTPTLETLRQYDAVLVYSNFNFANSAALGNVLADYVDAGGGVVVAVFALTTTTNNRYLTGRWDHTYQIIPQNGGNFSGTVATLGFVHDPDHPIMANVNSFNGGNASYRPATTDLTAHGVKIAEWSDGKTLVAVSTTLPNRADLGFFPPSSHADMFAWDASTDGAILMANALAYVAAGSGAGCPVDWNDDGSVNSSDISAFLTGWLDSLNNQNLNADFDNNGIVNSSDISAFLTAWLQGVTEGC